ncbi:Cysteine desulfurase IscS 2 [uncultured archaeon]|nr:Cysteine desulfurase IscS 2 [uncultured archaeon]
MKQIYLDYSATTPTRKEVLAEALPYFNEKFGNPSSFHSTGLVAKKAMSEARAKIAEILHAAPEEVIFTGSGTESINLALKGIAFCAMLEGKKGVFITQKTEHHAVFETLEWLEKLGFEVINAKIDEFGVIDLADLRALLEENKGNVLLVSIMYANNEIGTIQPIREIADICHEYEVIMHTDACQGAEYLNLNTEDLGVDMMTLNGSKVYAFKGTGLLFKKNNVKIEPLIHGGAHEGGMRAGTENVAGIVAFAKALEIAEKEKKKESARLSKLRDYMIKKIQKEIPNTLLNGDAKKRLPNNVNISFEGVEGESILLRLNEKGIRVSTGSACSSQSLDPSHVLLGIGRPHGLAHGSIRFSLGHDTTKKQIDYTIKELKGIIKFLREISPVWEKNDWKRKIKK